MKKRMIALIFVLFAISLMAQTGIYGLGFGQKITDVEKKLKEQGFTELRRENSKIYYSNSSIPHLEELYLDCYGEYETIFGWQATYTADTKELEDAVFEELEDIHGSYDYFDDYYEEYVWELYNDKAIYVYYSIGNRLVVDYTLADDEDWW